jgi:hypothetical protein
MLLMEKKSIIFTSNLTPSKLKKKLHRGPEVRVRQVGHDKIENKLLRDANLVRKISASAYKLAGIISNITYLLVFQLS